MRRAIQAVGAVAMGVLLATSMVLGGVMMMNPNVNSLDGAADHVVQPAEGQVAIGGALLVGAATVMVYDHFTKNDPKTEDLQKADALETETEIYDQVSIQRENNDISQTSLGNYLNDTESIALMEGKNAYIRALENGSAESVARTRAREAVSDYYAVKQQNLIAAWNVTATVFKSGKKTAKNTTGVASDFIGVYSSSYSGASEGPVELNSTSVSITLVNGTSVPVESLDWTVKDGSSSDTDQYETPFGERGDDDSCCPDDGDISGFYVNGPTESHPQMDWGTVSEFNQPWTEVEAQNSEVQDQVDDFINATYDSYQQGTINASDLVDPYLGAREYTPETSDSWALRTLSSMGMNSPENLSNIGRMEIVSGSVTYTGILMSDGTPADGYVVGDTYNTSNIAGAEFVALDSGDVHELEGTFTLKSAETTEGETIATNETVRYTNVTYETADTQEFQALQQQLDNLTAQLNARQDRLRNSGGGGGFLPDFGFGGIGGIGIPVLLLAAAAVLVGRN